MVDFLLMCLKTTALVANSVEPDQLLYSAASRASVLFAQTYLSQYLGIFYVIFLPQHSQIAHVPKNFGRKQLTQ